MTYLRIAHTSPESWLHGWHGGVERVVWPSRNRGEALIVSLTGRSHAVFRLTWVGDPRVSILNENDNTKLFKFGMSWRRSRSAGERTCGGL